MPHKGYKQTPEVIAKRAKARIGWRKPNKTGWIHQGRRMIQDGNREVLEHRYVMEQHLGRPLEKYEVVHHIDKNPLNNKIENLQLMTKSHHSTFHDIGKTRTGQLTEDGKRRKSESTKKRWENGDFDNRPAPTEEVKAKISESIKKVRAARFWSSGRHKVTSP